MMINAIIAGGYHSEGFYMQYIRRLVDIDKLLVTRTVLLFGPRQIGKSTYVREQLHGVFAKSVSLLLYDNFVQLSKDPSRLRKEIEAENLRDCCIYVDEIQKIPELLDEIHWLIEERQIRFLLTGSSARKLKREGINLLGGRGRDRMLHPFVYQELKEHGFDLNRALYNGLVPNHYLSEAPDDDLRSYVNRYLTEEIRAEGISRNVPAFSRFLEAANSRNAELVNYTAISKDCGVPRQTVQNYFTILQDTLLGYNLAAYTLSRKRKAIETHKFYFFDTGVARILSGLTSIPEKSVEFGRYFEHYIFHELKTFIDYMRPGTTLEYWRSTSNFEVDFIFGRKLAIEVKAKESVSTDDLKGLKILAEENLGFKYILLCKEKTKRVEGDIVIYPWKDFLEDLWNGLLF